MQNKNQIIIIGANLRFSGFCGISSFSDWLRICWIWSLLYYNFYTKLNIYMNFRINLTKFYINFLRQKHQIDILYVSFNAWESQVSFYTPFHSFIYPLSFILYPLSFFLNFFIINLFLHIYSILYKSSRFKQIIFNKYETNLKTIISTQESENLRFASIIIFKFLFCIFNRYN